MVQHVPSVPRDGAAPQQQHDTQHKMTDGPFIAVASDMDGTVLDTNHHLTDFTKSTLYELSSLGVHVIIATGRHHLSVASTKQDLLQYYRKRRQTAGASGCLNGNEGLYIITSNGARVHNPAGEAIVSRDLDSSIVRTLYEKFALRDHGESPQSMVSTSAYQTNIWWQNRTFMSAERMLEKFGVVPEVRPNIMEDFPTTGVGKVCFRCENRDILHQYEKEINLMFHGRVEAAMSSDLCLDVMAAGVSKGTALQEIGKILNFDPARDVIAFGDSMNDRDMLATVAKGCVMRNGQQRLKASLPNAEVIDSNDEDGVARKLRAVFQMDTN
ncbi:putative haloacid dehalogenase hydrolase [Trypanosoma grayi]|uniref:putative haloacid dehalogenase hydrolase n=1 Tax=Trypanosoma grayi TaxID=71804 RepID=UPI0004F4867F|nr:putative haloacid dehalogenase hydrolase [Trypanosoma grayi]KEG07604.1 putative haloacid dehalogenase hydrolase [Trypanosoma grayi]